MHLSVDWHPRLPGNLDLRIGVISGGSAAMDYHPPGYAAADLPVVAVADLDETALAAADLRQTVRYVRDVLGL